MHRFGILNLKFRIQVRSPLKRGLRLKVRIGSHMNESPVGIPPPMKRGLRHNDSNLQRHIQVIVGVKRGLRHEWKQLPQWFVKDRRNSSPDEEGTETRCVEMLSAFEIRIESEFLPR